MKHPLKPEWGIGLVLDDATSSTVRVLFERAGEKQMSLAHVNLKLVTGTKAKHQVLDKRARLAQELSPYCIYTIVSGKTLAKEFARGKPTTFVEKKSWVTGYVLWQKAKAEGRSFPVLFGDAADCSRLLYWALLTKMQFDASSTEYTIDRLRRFKGRRTPQELILRSSGKTIAPGFIRPYAICVTPSFVAFA